MLFTLRAAGGLLALALLANYHKNEDTTPDSENLNVTLTPVATSTAL